MRIPIVLSIFFCVAHSIALGQQPDTSKSLAPAPRKQTTPQVTPQIAPARNASPQTAPPRITPPQTSPPQIAPLQTAPQQPAPPVDDLSLDANRSFDFGDSDNTPYSRASDPQTSIASNSEFRGASPQMMGDFGGGSTILKLHNNFFNPLVGPPLTVQIPFAGGSRRIKVAENNQVQPLNRIYGTYNYFDNAIVSSGPGAPVQSNGLSQYTLGIEKTFLENFSIDVRMPLVGAIDYTAYSFTAAPSVTAANVQTSGVGNLSTSFKALLLQMGQTSISTGLQLSIPTGSDARIEIVRGTNVPFPAIAQRNIIVDNDALHLMPFIGVYREIGNSWWLQGFTQIDVPTSGNDVRVDGVFLGRINEQTLLYSDVSLGKWLYRNRGSGVTGAASILELHYTSSLNDADRLFTASDSGPENRLDVLNLTAGLLVEFSQQWRINVSGVVPLRDREFDPRISDPDNPKRREDRFFDGELSLQINRFF